jgi:hypothetical protein
VAGASGQRASGEAPDDANCFGFLHSLERARSGANASADPQPRCARIAGKFDGIPYFWRGREREIPSSIIFVLTSSIHTIELSGNLSISAVSGTLLACPTHTRFRSESSEPGDRSTATAARPPPPIGSAPSLQAEKKRRREKKSPLPSRCLLGIFPPSPPPRRKPTAPRPLPPRPKSDHRPNGTRTRTERKRKKS